MFSQTDEFKLGEKAYNDGHSNNENPWFKKSGFINEMKYAAWDRGHRYAKIQDVRKRENW